MRKVRRRILSSTLLLLLMVVAVSPYIGILQPLRNLILGAALPGINGTATCSSVSLGWFSPVAFRDVEICSPDAAPVLSAARVRGDRPAWQYLFGGRALGTLRMEQPRLKVVVREDGSNLKELLAIDDGEPRPKAIPPNLSLGLEIVDGGLSFQSRHAVEPWSVDGFNLALGVQGGGSTDSGQPELVVHQGIVLDHAPITPAMCDDLLKYIAPVLAEATEVSGEFSIELDDWRLPLEDLERGEGSGRLTIHAVDVGAAGPLVHAVTTLAGLPSSVRLADNSIVEFAMAEGRVHHRDLRFGVGGLQVRTEGSVGLDQTLDLVAEIPIPTGLLKDVLKGAPWPEQLKTSTLTVPICGTLHEPHIDPAGLGTSNVDLVLETLGELLRRRAEKREGGPEKDVLLDGLGKLLRKGAEEGGGLLDPDRQGSGETPLLDRLRETPLLQRLRRQPQPPAEQP